MAERIAEDIHFDSCIGQVTCMFYLEDDGPLTVSFLGDEFELDNENYPTYKLDAVFDDWLAGHVSPDWKYVDAEADAAFRQFIARCLEKLDDLTPHAGDTWP